jgi:hypothetical protein
VKTNDGGAMLSSSGRVDVKSTTVCDATGTWKVVVKPNGWCDAILYGVSVRLTSRVIPYVVARREAW